MIYTFQALSEEDRGMWLDAMDGKEPMYVHAPKPSNAHQTFLDEGGFLFIQRCFQTLENRGLEDQGTIFTEPEKKILAKKLVKSNKSISRVIFLTKFHFL